MIANDLLSSMQGRLQESTKPARYPSTAPRRTLMGFPAELQGAFNAAQTTFTDQSRGDRFPSNVAIFPKSNRIIANQYGVLIPQVVLGNDVVVACDKETLPSGGVRVVVSAQPRDAQFKSARRVEVIGSESLEREFRSLAERWRNETTHLSISSEKANNFAYQQIVGMGEQVLPLIFRELETTTSDWFWALRAIARDRAPVIRAEDRGRVRRIAEIWMEWGKQIGYVSG